MSSAEPLPQVPRGLATVAGDTVGQIPTAPGVDPRIVRHGRIYWVTVVLILVAAVWQRFSFTSTPFADPDTWGYLRPAITTLVDGEFLHTGARSFVYPGFLYLVLEVFGTFKAISVAQHLFGLASALLLLAAWQQLEAMAALRGRLRRVGGALGLAMFATLILSTDAILFEHILRPESTYAFAAALTIFLGLRFFRTASIAGSSSSWRTLLLGVGFLFASHLLYLIKPQSCCIVPLALVPIALVARKRCLGFKRAITVFLIGTGLAIFLLWLPERHFAKKDQDVEVFLPSVLFFLHMDLIAEVHGDGPGGGAAEDLPVEQQALMRRLTAVYKNERAKFQAAPAKAYPILGFNPDALLYGKAAHVLAAHFKTDYPAFREFCYGSFGRALTHAPLGFARKVSRQLGVFYMMRRNEYRKRATTVGQLGVIHVTDRLVYAANSLEYLSKELTRYPPALDYMASLRDPGDRPSVRGLLSHAPWIRWYRRVNNTYVPALIIFLVLGAWLIVRRRRERRAGGTAGPGGAERGAEDRTLTFLGGIALLMATCVFGINLTAASIHTLEISRYIVVQQVFVLFSLFTMVAFIVSAAQRLFGGWYRAARSGSANPSRTPAT